MNKRTSINIFTLAMSISCLVAPQVVYGQPSISGVDGIVAHGETVTIAGSDFGPGAEILTWDTFESGTPDQTIHGQGPDKGYSWDVVNRESDNDVIYSNTRAKSGNQSARWGLTTQDLLFFGWVGKGPYKELYFSYWIYQRMQYNGEDCSTYIVPNDLFNYKRGYTYGRGGDSQGPQLMQGAILENRTNWTVRTQAQGNVPYISVSPNPVHSYADGMCHWDRFETLLRNEDAGSSNGSIKFWINNSTNEPRCYDQNTGETFDCDALDISSFSGTDAYVRDWRLGYLLRPGLEYEYAQAYYDNIYCATSRARVEIGDNANFANCTRRGICPHVTWNGSIAEVQIVADGYNAGEQAYLFVIDEDGDVSQGYGVEIGESIELPNDNIPPQITIIDSDLPLLTPPPHLATLSGSASDNHTVVEVSWQNSLGGQGTAQGNTSWTIDDLQLFAGDNVVTVTARDSANNLGTDQITIPWDFPDQPGEIQRNR